MAAGEPSLRQGSNKSTLGTYYSFQKLHTQLQWEQQRTAAQRYLDHLPPRPSAAQWEGIGLSIVIRNLTPHAGQYSKITGDWNPDEFFAAWENDTDFQTGNDWLTSLSRICWWKGQQQEGLAKKQAQHEGAALLKEVKTLDISRIDTLYRRTAALVYPTARALPTIRQTESNATAVNQKLVQLGQGNVEYAWYTSAKTAADIRYRLEDYLQNQSLCMRHSWGRNSLPIMLTERYCQYLFLHPHPDLNHTMAGMFVNAMLEKSQRAPIDWYAIKRDEKQAQALSDSFAPVTVGEKEAMIRWFDHQIR